LSGALCGGNWAPTCEEAVGEPAELAALAYSGSGRDAPSLRVDLFELPMHVLHRNQTHRVTERIHLCSSFQVLAKLYEQFPYIKERCLRKAYSPAGTGRLRWIGPSAPAAAGKGLASVSERDLTADTDRVCV
jgi:hypothetical protein